MIASLVETLLGQANKRPGAQMSGMAMRSARITAWLHRHRVARVEHVFDALVEIAEIRGALEKCGIHHADVEAVLMQLYAGIARFEDDEPDTEPPFDPALDALVARAMPSGVLSTARFIDAVAAGLPRELSFVRRPLAACASELGAAFDAMLSSTKEGHLTFEAWDPQLKKCVGLMQQLSDKKWESWGMSPRHLLAILLLYKPHVAYFKERGHDPAALLNDFAESLPDPTWPVRPRPPGLVPSISPALFAVFLRAERYAASDAVNVRLRHVLLALHDEPQMAPWIARLAS